MHDAALRGYFRGMSLLLKHGASVDCLDAHGDRPLHMAASNGHAEAISFLLDHAAAIDSANNFGLTPLHVAAYNDCQTAMNLLLQHGSQEAWDCLPLWFVGLTETQREVPRALREAMLVTFTSALLS